MIREPDRHRIGKARLLRRQGKTYNEIRAVIGPLDDKTLAGWLKGIPRPPETNRSRAQHELARECRRLRSLGLTQGEIIEKTGASVGSVSLWLRGVKVPPNVEARRQAHLQELRLRGSKAIHDAAVKRQKDQVQRAKESLYDVNQRDLFMVGVALYWAEGTKDKPWRRSGRVTIINSDPTVLRVFLAWLDLVGIASDDRRCRLTIHESADVATHEQWWAEQLRISTAAFQRATLKRHNPKPSRYNRGDSYHGCVVVTVAKSTALYDMIDGWWQAIAEGP
jgi:transcriptional regulator with XRE-family HTH domain